jgi:hypothetical protein
MIALFWQDPASGSRSEAILPPAMPLPKWPMPPALRNDLPFVCSLPCPISSCLQRKAHYAAICITGNIYFE